MFSTFLGEADKLLVKDHSSRTTALSNEKDNSGTSLVVLW